MCELEGRSGRDGGACFVYLFFVSACEYYNKRRGVLAVRGILDLARAETGRVSGLNRCCYCRRRLPCKSSSTCLSILSYISNGNGGAFLFFGGLDCSAGRYREAHRIYLQLYLVAGGYHEAKWIFRLVGIAKRTEYTCPRLLQSIWL